MLIWALGVAMLSLALPPAESDAEVARGRQLYNASCVRCHGIDGTGGEGPSLDRPALERAPDDEALREVIQTGLPGTDMPGTRYLDAVQVRQIAAYVRSLGQVESVPLRGDAERGRVLFAGEARCATCHIVSGRGETLGPDLTRIGSRRGAAYLEEHVRDPSAAVPESFLMVRVTTTGGKSVLGYRVNEDAFSIQLRDEEGNYHSFRKADLADFVKLPNRTFMPRYRSLLSDAEIDDLVAYLASLRGSS